MAKLKLFLIGIITLISLCNTLQAATATATPFIVGTKTPTVIKTAVITNTAIVVGSITPLPTGTATITPTGTPTTQSTLTPTLSSTITPTVTQTSSSTEIPSVTDTPPDTFTPTVTQTTIPLWTDTVVQSPTITQTPTVIITDTPTPFPTPFISALSQDMESNGLTVWLQWQQYDEGAQYAISYGPNFEYIKWIDNNYDATGTEDMITYPLCCLKETESTRLHVTVYTQSPPSIMVSQDITVKLSMSIPGGVY